MGLSHQSHDLVNGNWVLYQLDHGIFVEDPTTAESFAMYTPYVVSCDQYLYASTSEVIARSTVDDVLLRRAIVLKVSTIAYTYV